LNKINYSILNITNAPLFTYKVINDLTGKKGYEIEIQFIGTDINNLSNNTLDLLIQDVTNTLFYELDLVFYAKVSSTQNIILDSNLSNNSFSKLKTISNNTTSTPTTTTLNVTNAPIIKLCVPKNTIQTFKVLNSNLFFDTKAGFYICDLNNVIIDSGAILNITNGVTVTTQDNIAVVMTNGLQNYGTLNCNFNLILDGVRTDNKNVCNSYLITNNYWANYGCINLGDNVFSSIGATLNPEGNICAALGGTTTICPC
jgi:hypothetical protein